VETHSRSFRPGVAYDFHAVMAFSIEVISETIGQRAATGSKKAKVPGNFFALAVSPLSDGKFETKMA